MEDNVAAPEPIACHSPANQTALTGNTSGNQSDALLVRCVKDKKRVLTNKPDPRIVHKHAENGHQENLLPAHSIGQCSEWHRQQHIRDIFYSCLPSYHVRDLALDGDDAASVWGCRAVERVHVLEELSADDVLENSGLWGECDVCGDVEEEVYCEGGYY